MHFFKQLVGRSPESGPVPDCYILTGIPRAGTTLTCKLLSEQKQVVGLNEPIPFRELQSRKDAVSRIHESLAAFREGLLRDGAAPVRGKDGRITDNHFERTASGNRKRVIKRSRVVFSKPLNEDFKLFVKHNAVFTLLLDELSTCYPCYAMVRNPLAVLGSWSTVSVPVSRGQIRYLGLLNPEAQEKLVQIEGLLNRQLFLLDFYFKTYTELPQHHILRYENLISSNGSVLEEIIGHSYEVKTPLSGKNKGTVYSRDQMLRMGEALLAAKDHHCWRFYDRTEVEALYTFYEGQQ